MTAADQTIPALTAAAVALLTGPWLARLGSWGIQQWIAQELADQLRRVGPGWQVSSALIAVAMALGPLPEIHASGKSVAAAAAMIGLTAALLAQLARIDARCRLLPDPLTFGLLATGLLFHLLFIPNGLIDAMLGAVFGYGLLWGLAALFQRLRNIQAMGRGDFAMAAGIGALLGWQALPFALVSSCLLALIFAALMYVFPYGDSVRRGSFLSQELAFGPALAAGAALVWISLG